jgi:hypothetical protein
MLSRRYSIKVSVTSANSIRKFLKSVPFQFSSEGWGPEEVLQDGRMTFLREFQERLKVDPVMARKVGAQRYRIHATDVQLLEELEGAAA